MFSQASVILFTGEGVSAPVHTGIHTPPRQTPPGQTPLEQTPPQMTTAEDGTLPTGMHSCL